ncbi:MAG: GNAT family N-acetyltransferase [Candidatus Limnocylindrales bacterium]
MATVELRDIVTEDDYEAVMGLRRGAGREGYLGAMISHFEDAIADAIACPRYWSIHAGPQLVGFVMISDNIPAETLAVHPDIVGPYYLWRLLIDERFQGRGYGKATIAVIADYVRTRPGGDVLFSSCRPGDDSPMSFYLQYGFVKTGGIADGEEILRLDLTGRAAAAPRNGGPA